MYDHILIIILFICLLNFSLVCRLEEVTLRDFKAAFDRPGSFRFFVKTEDPDCGVVKEEIKREDTLLPLWKGRILVWISEKTHHKS